MHSCVTLPRINGTSREPVSTVLMRNIVTLIGTALTVNEGTVMGMAEYIDRGEAIEAIDHWFEIVRYYHPHSKSDKIPRGEVMDLLEQCKAIDAVEVVRCRDCVYWASGAKEDESWEYCYWFESEIDGNEFCSYGERKDGYNNG